MLPIPGGPIVVFAAAEFPSSTPSFDVPIMTPKEMEQKVIEYNSNGLRSILFVKRAPISDEIK